LCRDFSTLATHLHPSAVRVSRAGGHVTAEFEPAPRERLLLVGEMFRPEWQVAEAGAAVEPLLGALVGVRVPAGTTRVSLRYYPRLRAAFTIAAWTTMVLGALGLAAAFSRRNRT
jgi:hypothetical protein